MKIGPGHLRAFVQPTCIPVCRLTLGGKMGVKNNVKAKYYST